MNSSCCSIILAHYKYYGNVLKVLLSHKERLWETIICISSENMELRFLNFRSARIAIGPTIHDVTISSKIIHEEVKVTTKKPRTAIIYKTHS